MIRPLHQSSWQSPLRCESLLDNVLDRIGLQDGKLYCPAGQFLGQVAKVYSVWWSHLLRNFKEPFHETLGASSEAGSIYGPVWVTRHVIPFIPRSLACWQISPTLGEFCLVVFLADLQSVTKGFVQTSNGWSKNRRQTCFSTTTGHVQSSACVGIHPYTRCHFPGLHHRLL